jgi:sarcosine oxidase
MYDFAVIGLGMIGAAAARSLSAVSSSIVAIGPGEPDNWRAHWGVFASHYDEARITRILDPDLQWAQWAAASIANYAAIERRSGLRFHFPVGCLRVNQNPRGAREDLAPVIELGREMGVDFAVLDSAGLHERFPFLSFGVGSQGVWEVGGAGYINPRTLVQAQLVIARQQGATIVRETVQNIHQTGSHVEIETDAGGRYQARRALVTAGAWTNGLLPKPLALRPKKVTVVFAELDEEEAQRLAAMPSILYRLDDYPHLSSVYCLPPIRYPNGKTYVKIGGSLIDPLWAETPAELTSWFHGDGDTFEADAVRSVLLEIIPGLRVRSFHSKPCTYTMTPHAHPYLEQVADHLFVAAGGCGTAAKSSDEIGRLAAQVVLAQGDGKK